MKRTARSLPFVNTGYYFIVLFLLAIAGFWPSYFAKFFDGSADFSFYFHFHAVLAIIWIFFLIAQPLLIRQKKFAMHRSIGKSSYILVPLIFISVTLLAHNRLDPNDPNIGISLWIPFKDLLIFATGYGIAIKYRRKMPIHARGMIVAGMVLIEPALVRFIQNVFFEGPDFVPAGYLATITVVYLLLIGLIIWERNHKMGRWVFPLTLGLYLFVHAIIVFQVQIAPWRAFAQWFAALPLT